MTLNKLFNEMNNFILENFEQNKILCLKLKTFKQETDCDFDSEKDSVKFIYVFFACESIHLVKISFFLPSLYLHTTLLNKKKHLDLVSYLHHINRDYEIKEFFSRYFRDRDRMDEFKYTEIDYAKDKIRLFIKYLETDLLDVVNGKKWLEIPSYLEGYND